MIGEFERTNEISNSSQRRLDIEFSMNGKTYLLDVSIVHPTAPSNLTQHTRPLLAQRSRSKKAFYFEVAQHKEVIFIPVIFSSFGAYDKGFQKLLNILKTHVLNMEDPAAPWVEIHHGIIAGVAAAIQEGNSKALDMWARRSRREVSPLHL